MRISELHIQNFRCIRDLRLDLDDTTVFIGQNNAGKTAVIDAVRIVLTRRWGVRGTGFTENDVHRPNADADPKTLPPVTITLSMREPQVGAWDADMVAALDGIMAILADGRNVLSVKVTCAWSPEKEAFEPVWQFLDAAGIPLPERRRSINLTGFFGYANAGGLSLHKSSFVVLLILLGLISSGQAQELPSPNGTVVSGGFETRYGTQWFNGRLVSALGDLPVAIGLGGTVNDRAIRLDAGIAAQLGEQSIVSLVFRGSNERADQALGVVTDERINTYAFSGRLEHTLSGAPAITVFGLADAWYSPGGVRLQTGLLSTTSFGGADGFRLAPGFELSLDGGLSVTGSAGWENGSWNGVSGLFAEIEAVMPLAAFALSAKAWTSPNFGTGAKASVGYEFDTGLQVSLFAGYERAAAEHAFAGIRFSMPLGGEPGGGSSPLSNTLGAHMDHVAETMPGVPFTARSGVTVASTAPPAIFRDVNGTACAAQEATPGCTFRLSNGSRLKVSDDPDFNRFGGGSNDLWYVTFDGAGNAQVFNELGQFQYFANASDFPGHIGGSTIGVGTTGFYWEDVIFGTYWLGRNQVLYSANGGAGNWEEAIN